jgi:hypothetical protein
LRDAAAGTRRRSRQLILQAPAAVPSEAAWVEELPMDRVIRAMARGDVRLLLAWRYAPPYDVYDVTAPDPGRRHGLVSAACQQRPHDPA